MREFKNIDFAKLEYRQIDSSDLPSLGKLINSDEILHCTDICFEHSYICYTSDDPCVLSFVVFRKKSLVEFCGGEIPCEIMDKSKKHYPDGYEFYVKEILEQIDEGKHYELIFAYCNQDVSFPVLHFVYNHAVRPNRYMLFMPWWRADNVYISSEILGCCHNYNNMFYIDRMVTLD